MRFKKLLVVALPIWALYCCGFSSCSSVEEKETDPRITTLPFEPYNDSIHLKNARILKWKVEKDDWSGETKRRYLETYLEGWSSEYQTREKKLILSYDLESEKILFKFSSLWNKDLGENVIFEVFNLKGDIIAKKEYKFDWTSITNREIEFYTTSIKDEEEKRFLQECFIPTKCNESGDTCRFMTDTLYRFTKVTIPLGKTHYDNNDHKWIFEGKDNIQFGWINYNKKLENALYKKELRDMFNFLNF